MLIYKHSRGTAKLIITQTTYNRRLKVYACVLLSVTKKKTPCCITVASLNLLITKK